MKKSNRKILILTMSCNIPYFQALLGAVRNTWAKPLLNDKYENVTWFAYTSCDDAHPVPCVDFKDHMIYVDAEDGYGHTYGKTKRAWEMVKDIVDFDFVVRTNTSVFVNLDLLIERVNQFNPTTIMGRMFYYYLDDELTGMLMGFFFGMDKSLFDMSMDVDDNYIMIDGKPNSADDDRILSKRLFGKIGENFYGESIGFNDDETIQCYRACDDFDVERITNIEHNENIKVITDPSLVNQTILTKVRSFYVGPERFEKSHEIEHMYELYNALR